MRLTGTRHTSIRVEMLDHDETPLGPLGGVQDGTIRHTIAATIKSSGNIVTQNMGQAINWLTVRLQPILTINGVDYPLGVFLPSAPVENWSAMGMSRDISILDKLTILDQTVKVGYFSLPAGTNAINAVRDLILEAGERAGAITDSSETLRGSIVWEPGTPYLRIINDILDAAGYFSLWCDVHGQYRAEPYVAPPARPVAWQFEDGPRSIRHAEFTREHDVWKIPNRVIAMSRSSADEEMLISIAENTDPDSPTSFPARGRWIDHIETDVETTSQEVLNAHAQRHLTELSSATETFTISHAFTGNLELNQTIQVTDTDSGHDQRCVIQQMQIPLTATDLCTLTARGITA